MSFPPPRGKGSESRVSFEWRHTAAPKPLVLWSAYHDTRRHLAHGKKFFFLYFLYRKLCSHQVWHPFSRFVVWKEEGEEFLHNVKCDSVSIFRRKFFFCIPMISGVPVTRSRLLCDTAKGEENSLRDAEAKIGTGMLDSSCQVTWCGWLEMQMSCGGGHGGSGRRWTFCKRLGRWISHSPTFFRSTIENKYPREKEQGENGHFL